MESDKEEAPNTCYKTPIYFQTSKFKKKKSYCLYEKYVSKGVWLSQVAREPRKIETLNANHGWTTKANRLYILTSSMLFVHFEFMLVFVFNIQINIKTC